MCGIMASASSAKSAKKREEEYQAEDDLRTLSRAEEIRADQKRMAACDRAHRKQTRSLSRVGRALKRSGGRSAR